MAEQRNVSLEIKLAGVIEVLRKQIKLYDALQNNEVFSTPELKKVVQSSIKELCTIVCDCIEN